MTALPLARVELPDFHPEAPGSDTIHGFLVRDADECVLVDTGVGTGSDLIEKLYKPARVDIAVALEAVGASMDQITAIVNSHLHFDHCGNNGLFPGLPIFVQQDELDAARKPHYTVPDWVDFPGANYVPLHGAHPISAHLELVPTPGHTPGHQSLLVRSGNHVEMVVAQAAYTAAEFQHFLAAGIDAGDDASFQPFVESNATWSHEAYLGSLAAIQQIGPQRAFFSHDPEPWERAV